MEDDSWMSKQKIYFQNSFRTNYTMDLITHKYLLLKAQNLQYKEWIYFNFKGKQHQSIWKKIYIPSFNSNTVIKLHILTAAVWNILKNLISNKAHYAFLLCVFYARMIERSNHHILDSRMAFLERMTWCADRDRKIKMCACDIIRTHIVSPSYKTMRWVFEEYIWFQTVFGNIGIHESFWLNESI